MIQNDVSSMSSRYGDGEEDKIIKQLNQVRSMKNSKKRGAKIPREIASLMAQAKNQYIFGQPEKAQKILEDIIRNYPDYEEAYQIYGRICQDQHDSARAANFLMLAAKSKSSSNQKNWSNIAYLLKDQSNYKYEMAALYFGKALKSDPNNVQLMEERAICYQELGDYRKAIKELDKIRLMAESLQIVDKSIQSTKLIAKQYDKAKEELNKIVSIQDVEIIILMIQIFIQQQEQSKIIPFIEEIYELKKGEDNQQLYKKLIIAEHYDVVMNWLIALKPDSETNFNSFSLQYLSKLYEDGNIVKFNDFFTSLDKFSITLEVQILQDLIEIIKHNSQFHQIEQSLLRRLFIIVGKVEVKQEFQAPKYLLLIQQSFQQEFTDFVDQQRLLSDSKSESESKERIEIYYLDNQRKIKIQDEMASQIFFSDEEDNIKQEAKSAPKNKIKPFSELILETLEELIKIQTREEINYIYSQITQLITNNPDQLDKIFSLGMKIISFETKFHSIRKQLMDRFSKESQKCNFKKAIKSANFLQQLDLDSKPIVFKTNKLHRQQEYLKKKKNKIAELKTDDQLKGIYCLSLVQTGEIFLQMIFQVAKLLFDADRSYQLYLIIYELKTSLQIMVKKWMKSIMQQQESLYISLRYEYAIYGLWSTLKQQQYIHSFPFIKQLVKINPNNHLQTALLALVLRKLNNPQIYKTWLAKITPNIQKNKNMIMTIANQHYNNACFKPAMELYDYLSQSNPQNSLLSLLLSLSHLQMSTSRLAVDREQLVKKALYFFDQYREIRGNQGFHFEILYNMGRFYLHLNLLSKAMNIFEEILQHCQRQKIMNNGHQDSEVDNNEALRFKSAFNLIQLHKYLGNNDKAIEYLDLHLTF